MPVIWRTLTVNFARSVRFPDQTPASMQVVVFPRNQASMPSEATFVEPAGAQTVLLSDPINTVTFDLIPSNAGGLDEDIVYCIQWRAGVTGRTFTYDFAMPDQDVDFDQLGDLDHLIDAENYLRWTDLGVPERVAQLNVDGDVVDSEGNVVATSAALTTVADDLADEIIDRAAADVVVASDAQDALEAATTSILGTVATNLAGEVDALEATANSDRSARIAADNALGLRIDGTESDISDLTDVVDGHTTTLDAKADLVTGKVPLSQVPNAAITTAVSVDDQAAMLALTTTQVQPGDLAVRPDGTFLLTSTDPSVLGNWTNLSTVVSVNSKTGAVVVDLDDVSAAGGEIGISQVTGLQTALDDAGDETAVDALDVRVTAIEGDATIVKLVGGVIPNALNDDRMVYLNESNEIVDKEGNPLIDDEEIQEIITRTAWFDGAADYTDVADPADFQTEHSVELRGPFSVDSGGSFTYSLGGSAPVGETNVYPYITPNGHLELRVWDESADPDPELALQSDLDTLETTVGTKADQADLDTLETTVGTKADQADLDTLETTVGTKADQADLDTLETTVGTKADQTDMDTVESALVALTSGKADLDEDDYVALSQIPDLEIVKITGLQDDLDAKADLVDDLVPLSQIPSLATSKITGLDTALAARATLVGGTIPVEQLPAQALNNVTVVASKAAMLAQSASVVQPGDMTIVNATADIGNYILSDDDPSVEGNWVKLVIPEGNVSSVNGHTGTVVLDAEDVGARDASVAIPQADVSNLVATLAAKATPADVTTQIDGSVQIKLQVARVATTAVPSTSGAQSIDGALATAGTRVLLTAQSSSINNGIWIVQSGSWTRPTDFATASRLVTGTVVAVSDGTVNSATLWQNTAASGTVGTDINNWSKIGSLAPPDTAVAGNGIAITDATFSVKPHTGISVSSSGVAIDSGVVVRKIVGTVPSGSTIATLVHNLNTTSPMVQVIETASGLLVAAGIQVTGANTVSVEFASAPAFNQYRYIAIG